MVFLFFTLLYRSTWVLRTLVIFGIAQCGFLGSITKVIAIEERTKDWSNRECQNKYSRTVKLRVKCLKSLEKEPKSSLCKNDKWIQQDQVIRRGKNISKYPPCVFVYAKSVGNWMRLGHIHIQLYNETFIVHANTSTSTNQLKYMAIHSWF
jgi:hypothetical protein